jgi:hypothetical protein
MNEFEVDDDVRGVDDRLKRLARQISLDVRHKQTLRSQLLQRHAELSTDSPSGGLLRRFSKMKRLVVVAPAALSAAAIAAVVVVSLQISGQQQLQPADAQRLEPAVVRTVPTITGWSTTVTRFRSNSTYSSVVPYPLPRNIWAYISKYNGKPFPVLYVSGHPKKVPAEWQWAFARLPTALVEGRYRILTTRKVVGGTSALGVRVALSHGSQANKVDGTAWVDVSTGRILALERQVYSKGRLTEEDWARYQYRAATT